VHLWKVRSHIGIVGNEIADETAVAVSNGQVLEAQQEPYTTPSNNRGDMYWLYTEKLPEAEDMTGPAGMQPPCDHNIPDQPPTFIPMPNMCEALKAHIHKLKKLGSSRRDTVYFKAWKDAEPRLSQPFSHQFMTSTRVTNRQRKLAIQYRYGLLPTNKLLHRYKKSTTANCSMCGQPDGGHHAVSGCRQLSKATTLRHNEAGIAIVEAIQAGVKGNQLVAADIGVNKRRKARGKEALAVSRVIPLGVLPRDMPPEVKESIRTTSIPDAMLYTFNRKKRCREYTLVELKYCRDTRPEDQEARAEQQHLQIVQALKTHDTTATVKHCKLMLGVSGAIYQSTIQHLKEDLGIEGSALDNLLKQLHLIAVEHLEKIWRYRSAKINNRLGGRRKQHTGQKHKRTVVAPHRTTQKQK